MTIVKRATKGSALTYSEMDENIRDLYEDTTLLRALTNGTGSAAQVKGTTIGIIGGSLANANDPTSRHGPIVDIYRDVNRADESLGSTKKLGGIAFSGHNEDDVKVSYASIFGILNSDADDGEHTGSRIVFAIADGIGGAPFSSYLDDSFNAGHATVLNASADALQTVGKLSTSAAEIQLGSSGSKQNLHATVMNSGNRPSANIYLPTTDAAKVISVGGMGPASAFGFTIANKSTIQMLQYRGQHMVKAFSAANLEFDLPIVQNNSTLSTTTAGVGDVWQISNAGNTGTTITLDRDGSGTAQDVYWVNGSDLVPFTNNPTIAFGGSLMIQAVYAGTYMIFNATGLTDA